MPQMGESVTEGTILEWRVAEGQEVAEGDTVVEVSTDKIDAEVPAPASGVITKILAQPDDTVAVGQALAQIDPDGTASGNGASADGATATEELPGRSATGEGDADLGDDSVPSESAQPGKIETPAPTATSEPSADPAAPSGETVQVVMPEMGESVTEGVVLEWHVAEGDTIAEGDTVVEVSTDKVDAEVPAPASGTITKLLAAPDDTVQVGQVLAELETGDVPPASSASPPGAGGSDEGRPLQLPPPPRPTAPMARMAPMLPRWPAASPPQRESTSAR